MRSILSSLIVLLGLVAAAYIAVYLLIIGGIYRAYNGVFVSSTDWGSIGWGTTQVLLGLVALAFILFAAAVLALLVDDGSSPFRKLMIKWQARQDARYWRRHAED